MGTRNTPVRPGLIVMEKWADWHLEKFTDFARKVRDISGATPHLRMVGHSVMPTDDDFEGVAWRGGLYAATYNYPVAEVIWQHWSLAEVLRNAEMFYQWIEQHWAGLPLRKERKAVNSPRRLADCIFSYAQWVNSGRLNEMYRASYRSTEPYQAAWDVFQEVKYMGRYISIRYLEYMRRYASLPARMPDARCKGGDHPREGLFLLYPDMPHLISGDTVEAVAASELTFIDALAAVKKRGLELDHYSLQSLICEYKQAWHGHQYPVQALDSELGYYHKVFSHFGEEYRKASQFFQIRKALFPEKALGEVQGWIGKRKVLGRVLPDYEYNWSDLEFSYLATEDFAKPVRHGDEAVSNKARRPVSTGTLFESAE